MIKCVNCKSACRDTDIYCRNCGIKIKKNSYYIMINILTITFTILLILALLLLVSSYIVK